MSIPTNIVIIWSGAIIDIPDGWFLCDGQNGTPNLQNRFVVGAGNTYALDTTGGNKDAAVISHTHSISLNTTGSHTHTYSGGQSSGGVNNVGFGPYEGTLRTVTAIGENGGHTHTLTSSTIGNSGVNANMPPYYALAYIMYGGE